MYSYYFFCSFSFRYGGGRSDRGGGGYQPAPYGQQAYNYSTSSGGPSSYGGGGYVDRSRESYASRQQARPPPNSYGSDSRHPQSSSHGRYESYAPARDQQHQYHSQPQQPPQQQQQARGAPSRYYTSDYRRSTWSIFCTYFFPFFPFLRHLLQRTIIFCAMVVNNVHVKMAFSLRGQGRLTPDCTRDVLVVWVFFDENSTILFKSVWIELLSFLDHSHGEGLDNANCKTELKKNDEGKKMHSKYGTWKKWK